MQSERLWTTAALIGVAVVYRLSHPADAPEWITGGYVLMAVRPLARDQRMPTKNTVAQYIGILKVLENSPQALTLKQIVKHSLQFGKSPYQLWLPARNLEEMKLLEKEGRTAYKLTAAGRSHYDRVVGLMQAYVAQDGDLDTGARYEKEFRSLGLRWSLPKAKATPRMQQGHIPSQYRVLANVLDLLARKKRPVTLPELSSQIATKKYYRLGSLRLREPVLQLVAWGLVRRERMGKSLRMGFALTPEAKKKRETVTALLRSYSMLPKRPLPLKELRRLGFATGAGKRTPESSSSPLRRAA